MNKKSSVRYGVSTSLAFAFGSFATGSVYWVLPHAYPDQRFGAYIMGSLFLFFTIACLFATYKTCEFYAAPETEEQRREAEVKELFQLLQRKGPEGLSNALDHLEGIRRRAKERSAEDEHLIHQYIAARK